MLSLSEDSFENPSNFNGDLPTDPRTLYYWEPNYWRKTKNFMSPNYTSNSEADPGLINAKNSIESYEDTLWNFSRLPDPFSKPETVAVWKKGVALPF